MSIVLSPEVEQQIEEIVRAEGFHSADDFLRIFVQRYHDHQTQTREWLESNREEIDLLLDEGIRALREGRSKRYDSESLGALAAQIKREGRIVLSNSVKSA